MDDLPLPQPEHLEKLVEIIRGAKAAAGSGDATAIMDLFWQGVAAQPESAALLGALLWVAVIMQHEKACRIVGDPDAALRLVALKLFVGLRRRRGLG
jgi:hypothetical protein